MLFLSTVAFMAEFNKMASVIKGLATNFEMEKEERMQNSFLGGISSGYWCFSLLQIRQLWMMLLVSLQRPTMRLQSFMLNRLVAVEKYILSFHSCYWPLFLFCVISLVMTCCRVWMSSKSILDWSLPFLIWSKSTEGHPQKFTTVTRWRRKAGLM